MHKFSARQIPDWGAHIQRRLFALRNKSVFMAQIRESCFRVVGIQDVDLDLVDMHSGFPVLVEREHTSYSSSLESRIDVLDEGNLVFCELQSEDVLQTDGIWRFLNIDVFDESKLSFVEDAQLPDDRGQQIGYNIITGGGAHMEYSPEGYEELAVKLIGKQFDEEEWRSLQMDRYGDIYSWFSQAPPYEVIHQRIPDEGFLLSYYLSETGTQFAQDLKEGTT